MTRDGLEPEEHGKVGPMAQIEAVKATGLPVAFVGDVVGTGSSRKSAANSVLWYFGQPVTGVPNKQMGGVCIGGKIAPIFYNTMEDAGALVFEAPVEKMGMGDIIDIRVYDGQVLNEAGDVISEFDLRSDVLLDEVRAGGRINLIIGRGLTAKAREALGLVRAPSSVSPICQKQRMLASHLHRKWLDVPAASKVFALALTANLR